MQALGRGHTLDVHQTSATQHQSAQEPNRSETRGKEITLNPPNDDPLQPGDLLIVAGRDERRDELQNFFPWS